MELADKLELLASGARYDASCASSGSERRSSRGGACFPAGVCHSWTGDGRCVSLLKVLYSNVCRFRSGGFPSNTNTGLILYFKILTIFLYIPCRNAFSRSLYFDLMKP